MNKVKLSSSQIDAIEWVGRDNINGRFFHPFNCFIKKQTVKALLKMGLIQKCKDNHDYMELTTMGKSYFKTKLPADKK